jgi:hypothetical protein
METCAYYRERGGELVEVEVRDARRGWLADTRDRVLLVAALGVDPREVAYARVDVVGGTGRSLERGAGSRVAWKADALVWAESRVPAAGYARNRALAEMKLGLLLRERAARSTST